MAVLSLTELSERGFFFSHKNVVEMGCLNLNSHFWISLPLCCQLAFSCPRIFVWLNRGTKCLIQIFKRVLLGQGAFWSLLEPRGTAVERRSPGCDSRDTAARTGWHMTTNLTGANRAALVLTPLFWSERDFLYGRSNFYTFILFIDPFCCWNSSWGTISASSSTCFEQLMLPLGYSSRSWFSSLRCFCPCPVKKMLCKSFFFFVTLLSSWGFLLLWLLAWRTVTVRAMGNGRICVFRSLCLKIILNLKGPVRVSSS